MQRLKAGDKITFEIVKVGDAFAKDHVRLFVKGGVGEDYTVFTPKEIAAATIERAPLPITPGCKIQWRGKEGMPLLKVLCVDGPVMWCKQAGGSRVERNVSDYEVVSEE